MKQILFIFISVIIFSLCNISSNEPWEDLFDGKTLNGWNVKNGNAHYAVENGAVVGTAVLISPNTFLCTDSIYSDFILEYEFILNGELNSGVQIRSNSYPEFQDGRVHGYQVEIDPSERRWTGGIYDEARRPGYIQLILTTNKR